LLACEAHTGVTLQTLHPEKFDHGAILAQTPLPGFEIPNPSQCTYPELLRLVTPKAAEMLVQGIRDRVFLPGAISNTISISSKPYGNPIRHAPKITPMDRHIDWEKTTVDEILRRDRVLGRLWGLIHIEGQGPKRAVFGGLTAVPLDESFWGKEVSVTYKLPLVSNNGERVTLPCLVDGEAVIVSSPTGGAVRIEEITVAGDKKTGAAKALFLNNNLATDST
jgi:methionyl-tRNA formyltransferase